MLLPVNEALEQLLAQAPPADTTEQCSLCNLLGRVLATPLTAPHPVPPTDNSAMDGYAVRYRDLAAEKTTTLPLTQRIIAGDLPQPLIAGSAARIFTGAAIPAGADTVIPQEQCQQHSSTENSQVTIHATARCGEHIRRAGEDITQGSTFMQAGCRLQPQAIGLIAANGIATVAVFRRLKVALLSSGNELLMPGAKIEAGKLYNSNHATLTALLQALGCEIIDLGIVRDKLSTTINVLKDAAMQADLIISSGGVSVGEEDHIKTAIEQFGKLMIWRLNIKPGKPLAFGQISNKPFFALPGNPVSLFVTFCLFARPFILRMQGIQAVRPQPLKARAQFSHARKGARQEYLRSRIATIDNSTEVTTFSKQGSALLSSIVWANSLTVIPPGTTVKPGEWVEVIPFSELIA